MAASVPPWSSQRAGSPLDHYATGWHWNGWREQSPILRLQPHTEIMPVAFAKTWLLTTGWRRHGLISPWERPGPR